MRKKITSLLMFLTAALLVLAALVYGSHMQGDLSLDATLLSDENFNQIADNWEQLRQDAYEPIQCEGTDWLYIMGKGKDPYVSYYVNMGDVDAPNPFENLFQTRYSRENLWSECVTNIVIGNGRIVILYTDYSWTASSEKFESWFRGILEMVQK